MRQREHGFGILGIIVLTVALSIVVFIAWRLYGNVASPGGNDSAGRTQVTDFYSCWDRVGSISDTQPASCTLDGQRYLAPSAFNAQQVANLERAPEAARTQLIDIAEQVFNRCKTGKTPSSRPVVTMAQDNFTAIRVGCDSNVQRLLVLQGETWQEIDNGQLSLSCENVDRYGITQKTYIGGVNEDTDLCFYSDGRSKKIPA